MLDLFLIMNNDPLPGLHLTPKFALYLCNHIVTRLTSSIIAYQFNYISNKYNRFFDCRSKSLNQTTLFKNFQNVSIPF